MKLLKRLSALSILSLFLVMLLPLALFAASEGPNAPSTCANDASYGTTSWSSEEDAQLDDGEEASVSIFPGPTNYLKCTGFGFAIPAGATIDGIVVGVERRSFTASVECADDRMRIVKADGTIGTTNKATATTWPTTLTYEDHGGTTDTWGETWTSTDINDADFGAALAALRIDASCSGRVDHMRITVHYTAAAGGGAAVPESQVRVISIF